MMTMEDDLDRSLAARGLHLYPYQRDGIHWLRTHQTTILADEMGLGKTNAALLAADPASPVLVVCPAAVKGVWIRESKKWRPDLRPAFLEGRGSFRWPIRGELLACNAEILPRGESVDGKLKIGCELDVARRACPEGLTLIVDEAQMYKNATARRSRTLGVFAWSIRRQKGTTWFLTGTPLESEPPDLWGVLCAAGLERETFGSWYRFYELLGGRKEEVWISNKQCIYVTKWDRGVSPEVPRLLERTILRRRKIDVLPDLPEKRREQLLVDCSPRARRACDSACEELAIDGFDVESDDEAVLEALDRMFSDEKNEPFARARVELARSKIRAAASLADLHEEARDPLVVFSAHRAPVEELGGRKGWAKISGDTPDRERSAIEEAFQRGELRGVAGTIGAMGVGLTLTRASRAVFVDRSPVPAWNRQAEDRVHRITQTRGVLITTLVCDHPLDRRIEEICDRKEKTIAAALGDCA